MHGFTKSLSLRKGAPKEPKEQQKEKGVRSTPTKKEHKKRYETFFQKPELYTTYIKAIPSKQSPRIFGVLD